MSADVRDNEECTGDNTNSGVIEQVETRLSLDNVRDSPLYDAFRLPEPGQRLRFELRLF